MCRKRSPAAYHIPVPFPTYAVLHISCPHPFLAQTPVLKVSHLPILVALRRLQFASPQMIMGPQVELHACWSMVTQRAEKEPAGPLEEVSRLQD